MLKAETLSSDWQIKGVVEDADGPLPTQPKELELATKELEGAILWQRILVAPDGRPLSRRRSPPASLASAARRRPPYPRRSTALAANKMPRAPPEGVPRRLRMLLLLQSMGANSYDPKVVVQLMDVMYGWTASVSSTRRRMRVRVLPVTRRCARRPPCVSFRADLRFC